MKQLIPVLLLVALLLTSIFTLVQTTAKNAEALSALSFSNQATFTSVQSDKWQRVWTNTAGTSTYFADTSTASSFKSATINSATGATEATASSALVSTGTTVTSVTGSSTKNDVIFLQAVGGSTQSLLAGGTTLVVESIDSASSELIGNTINEVHFWVKKTGAPTGTATIAVFDSSCNTVYSFGTQDVSLLTTSFVETTYRGATTGRTLANGDLIGVFFNSGSAGNTFDVEFRTGSVFDTTLSATRGATGAAGSCVLAGPSTNDLRFQFGFDYVSALANDNDGGASYWENAGYTVRATQTDSTTNYSVGPGHVDLPAFVGEKKTTSSAFANVSVDTLHLRLAKTGSPTGTASVVEVNNDGTAVSRINQVTGSASTCAAFNDKANACAEHITSSGASIGQTINSVTVGLSKTGTVTGDLTVCVMNSAATCVYTFGTMTANSVGAMASYTFTNYAATHTVATDQYIGVKGDTQSAGNSINVAVSTTDAYDSTNSRGSVFTTRLLQGNTGTNSNVAMTTNIVEAEHINSGSVLIGKQVNQLVLGMLRTGTPLPSDSISACVFDSSGDCTYTFGTVAASTLSTSVGLITFTNGGATHTIAEGDYIGVKYLSGSTSNSVTVATATTSQFDGTATARATFNTSVKLNQNTGTATACNVAAATPTNACAEKITGTSALIGLEVDTLTGPLIRSGTGTGTIYACVMDSSATCTYTFGSIAATTITTSQASYSFHNPSATHTLASGEYVGFMGDTQSGSDTIATTVTTTDVYDSTNSIRSQYNSGAWVDVSTSDMGSSTSARNFRLDCHTCGSWAADSTTELGSSTANASFFLECTLSCQQWADYGLSAGTAFDLGNASANQMFRADLLTLPTVRNTFGTIDVSTLTTSEAVYSFQASSDFTTDGSATTYIGLLYTGGTFGNFINAAAMSVDAYDGTTNSILTHFGTDGAGFTDATNSDIRFRLVDRAQEASDQEAAAFIKANFGSAQNVGAVRVYWPDASKIPVSVTLSTSPDDISYTDRVTRTATQSTGFEFIEFDASYNIQYVKMTVATWGSSDFSMAVGEFQRAASLANAQLSPIESSGGTVYAFYVGTVSGTSKAAGSINVATGDIISAGTFTSSASTNYGCMTATKNKLYMGTETGTGGSIRIDSLDRDLTNLVTVAGSDLGTSAQPIACSMVTDGASAATDVTYWSIAFSSGTLGTRQYKLEGTGTLTTLGILGSAAPTALIHENTQSDVILRKLEGGTESTHTITKSSDTVSAALYTTDWITLSPQMFDFDGTTRTWKSGQKVYEATSARSVSWSATGTLSDPDVLYAETVTPGTELLAGVDDSVFYRISDTLVVSGSGTTWTPRSFTPAATLTPVPYSERLNVPLTLNYTLFGDNIFRLICDAPYEWPTAKTVYTGTDADCTGWRVLATSSATVGREIDHPYSRTADLVHTGTFTAYSFTLTATDPDNYFLESSYDDKKVDGEESDLSGQLQQRYLYGQCYDVTIETIDTSEIATVGTVCANDFFTKTIRVEDLTLATRIDEGATWYIEQGPRNTENAAANYATVQIDNIQRPWNASLFFTDHFLQSGRTYGTWYNLTSQTSLQTITIDESLLGVPLTSNDTLYMFAYDDDGNQIDPLVWSGNFLALDNPFQSLGNFAGVPLGIMAIVLVAMLWTKPDAYIGIIVTAGVTALMMWMGFIPIALDTPSFWGAIMVFVALGVMGAKKVFG